MKLRGRKVIERSCMIEVHMSDNHVVNCVRINADLRQCFDRFVAVRGVREGYARLTAEITAFSEAVTMFGSRPTPHRIWSPTAHST